MDELNWLILDVLFQFVYESEKSSKDADILKEISQGSKLKHVRCNDRSKPNLKGEHYQSDVTCTKLLSVGIRAFKRQLTKEEKLANGFSHGDDGFADSELEDTTKIKDDLESTKQLLELEVILVVNTIIMKYY